MDISKALDILNEAQRQAVQHPIGVPAMVMAGAGSGKTRVLTTRVAHLVANHSVHPSGVLLVTFTNKAAAEMTTRVSMLTGSGLPFSGTFHRICARILRASGKSIGLDPNFTIYDSDDQISLVTQIEKELGISTKEYRPASILSLISGAKNELVTPIEYHSLAKGRFQETASRVYPIYQRRLAQNGAVDFDDLLMKTVELLSQDEPTRRYYQQLFSHILIDEYQDTNTAQLTLTKLLLNSDHNLFVVGDFSQAIYSWRGADFRNMMSLQTQFPEMKTYELSQNYRSTQPILEAASAVIAHNSSHPVLELWTDKNEGEKLVLFEADTDREEVKHVVRETASYLQKNPFATIAVLYRTNAQSRAFEEGFLSAGISYRLVGGLRFYARKEIKDILAYLRLYVHAEDEIAKGRIEKLGKRKAAVFFQWLEQEKAREEEAVQRMQTETTDSVEQARAAFEIPNAKGSEQEHVEQNETSALVVVDKILENTKYIQSFDEHDEEDRGRLENIQEFRSVAASYPTILSLLEAVSLIEEEALRKETDEDSSRVTLMSIHGAKGLEFDRVFIVGMEEGIFPHSRSLLAPQEMEEERRLCYVAMTRARSHLTLSFARQRLLYGRISGSVVSRFIAEIPKDVVQATLSPRVGQMVSRFTGRQNSSFGQPKPVERKQVFTSFDDPSIDDFLEGNMDIDAFLSS